MVVRAQVMRQAKNLLVAYMPFKVHMHRVLPDLVQPWTKGYWRHPFMRDIWRFIDADGGRGLQGARPPEAST